MKKRMLLTCLVLVFLLSGCQLFNTAPAIKESSISGTLLFSDDFSSNTNGWGTSGNNIGEINFIYDGLEIKVNTPNSLLWTTTDDMFKDSQIEIDGVLLGGPSNDAFGAICRFQDNNNFYGFLLSHDGYYGIFKMQDGTLALIDSQSGLHFSEVIRQGGVVNHIQAVCQGTTLRLTVNGTLLSEVQDTSFSQGEIGLIVGTYETAGADVFFDNLLVLQP
jgi:hypothetical protein